MSVIASLDDIAPLNGTVTIRGKERTVTGIQAEGIVYLFRKFPVLREIISKRELADLTVDSLIGMAPEVIDSIIAVGLGHVASPEAEKSVSYLALDEKIHVLEKIMEVTLPRGIAPFMDMLNRLASAAVAPGWEQAMRSARR